MPSLQSRVISFFIRARVKRRPDGLPDAALVKHIRHALEPPAFLRFRPPAAARITPVETGECRGEWVEWQTHAAPEPRACTIYFLHGGGYVACSPRSHRLMTVTLAHRANARVFALDYRLAPEAPFPAPVEDAVAGYRWLLAQPGVDPARLLIMGDSAGGGLTIATLVAVRDAGLPMPKAAVVFSPWTDMAATGASMELNNERDPFFYAEAIRRGGKIYAGAAALTHPLASPLYADLRGLPPLQIHASDSEVLFDDSTRLTERARQAGVSVEFHTQADLPHDWPMFYGTMPEANATMAEVFRFIREQCNR